MARPRRRPWSRSAPAPPSTPAPFATRSRSTASSETAPRSSARRSAPRPSHLNDADAMTYRTPKVDGDGAFKGDLSPLGVRIDASGGWWDAGDYLKFVHATAYTDAVLLMGVRDFPAQMGAGAGPADFDAEARFGARWLLRMWDDRTRTLYYQVGIGNGNDAIVSDHDIWRLPQDDDTYGGRDPAFRYIRHRPVFRAGPPGSPVSPNLAGRDAAALALCYQVYRTTDRRLARNCLRLGRASVRPRRHGPEGASDDRDPVRLLSRVGVARRPRAGRRRAGARARTAGSAPRTAAPRPAPLRRPGRPLGPRLHPRAERRRRHPEPLRRERARPRRADPRHARARPRARRHPRGAARRPAPAAGPGRSPRGRPTRSGSATAGLSTTRRRTARASPSRRASTTS